MGEYLFLVHCLIKGVFLGKDLLIWLPNVFKIQMKTNIGKRCLKVLIDIYFLLIFLLQIHKTYVCLLLKSVILMKQFQYMKTRKITLQNILPYLSNYPWMPGEIGEKSLIARFLWWPNVVMMSTLSSIGWEASVLFFTANDLV